MSTKFKQILACTLIIAGIIVLFMQSPSGVIINLGILAVLIGMIWLVIA